MNSIKWNGYILREINGNKYEFFNHDLGLHVRFTKEWCGETSNTEQTLRRKFRNNFETFFYYI